MKDNAAFYTVTVNTHYSFSLKEQTKVQDITLKNKQWLFLINRYLLQQGILCLLENHNSWVKKSTSSNSFHSTFHLYYRLIRKYLNNLMRIFSHDVLSFQKEHQII